jgi:hypothetical protein
MVYRAFGLDRDQDAIFRDHAVPRPTNPNELFVRSDSIALDAQRMGLSALAFIPRDLIEALRNCVSHDLLVILEQRTDLKRKERVGHYRVCTASEGLARFRILDPRQPRSSGMTMTANMIRQLSAANRPEIVGNLIIAVGDKPVRVEQCAECGLEIPWVSKCGCCGQDIRLDLSALIGCPNRRCRRSAYVGVTCPVCNYDPPTPNQPAAV